ncbi:MAG: helix-turn-helix domain-containing protein [Bacteroidales bacterium]|nr:helix-turn-helix domain-containing protein [Bacteroidales bacterium]
MTEFNNITFEKLPEAVSRLMQDVAFIKDHILNSSAQTKPDIEEVVNKELLNVKEVSIKLGISEGAIYNLTHQKRIPHYKKIGRLFFDAREIDDWIRSDRRKTLKQLQEVAEGSSGKK